MIAYKLNMDFDDLLYHGAACIFAGTLVHSTACVINDICDIEFDMKVERSKGRPLAAGHVSVRGAWMLLALMTSACLYFLSHLNHHAMIFGLFGLFPLHGLYPFMKRWTWWPQAWLGITMNWGCIVVWLSIKPDYTQESGAILGTLLMGCTCWSIIYDTEYACQDRKDDIRIGLKSTAVLFGDYVHSALAFFSVVFVTCLALVGSMNNQGVSFYALSCGGTALHLLWQLKTWDSENSHSCASMFKANGNQLGYLVWSGLLLDYLLTRRQ
jgi:4-hydroxybenzoate polyprenyltransferase